jgi:hypothetical protein
MRKRKIESYIIVAAVTAFISGFGAGTAAEQHTQEEAARQQSTEMVTLQIYNETQKTWDTYQGTLDSECGLHGDWKYEIMGKELVLTGARLIGQVPEGETDE